MTERDRKRLDGCHADLIARVDLTLADMEKAGTPMMVTDGYRTTAQQMILWRKGRDAAGNIIDRKAIVTYCDGIRKKSNHQGGTAADCAFLVNDKPSWDEAWPWQEYGAAAQRHGLAWGGSWPKPKTDKPHVELA